MAVQPVAHHRFTVDEYHRMAEAGIFDEDSRVELLQGEIVEMAGHIEGCRLPEDGAYRDRVACHQGDLIAPEAFPDAVVEVASILPPG